MRILKEGKDAMSPEAKVWMSILIHEIRGIIEGNYEEVAVPRIEKLLNAWVEQNDLKPDDVKSVKSLEELK